MKQSAIFIALLTILVGCVSAPPYHGEFEVVKAQDEMHRLFGEPLSIDKFQNSPDTANAPDLARSGFRVARYERWTYASKRGASLGHTVITFRISNDGSTGFSEGISWMPSHESAIPDANGT